MKEENTKQNKNKAIKDIFKFSEVITIIFVTLVIGIIIGYAVTVNFKDNDKKDNDKALTEFINTYNDIKENYYEDVDSDDLINGAISGMLGALDDPYTTYLDQNETSDLNDRLTGSYSGIGVEITMDLEGNVLISNVFEDSPAFKAGLKEGDIFKKIGDEDVSKFDSSQISSIIKSNKEKTINITVLRDNIEIEVTLETSTIELDSVTYKLVEYNNKKIGYIDIDVFALNTYSQFKNALENLEKDNISSLIIDVRYNTGGYLDIVTDMISLFLEKNKIIYQLDEKDKITKIYDKTNESRNYNIIILANEYSASASEILASSLQESYKAKVVGVNTYGKGTVQQTKDLTSTGGMLKYTVQKWLTPNGNWINEKGVTPDVLIELDEKYYETVNEADDNQYQKALELAST